MLSSFIKIVGFAVSLFLLASVALGAEIKADNYDIYLGDLDGDGDDDFYFQQKPWYLILHGEIATPIMVQTNFAIHNSGGNYAAPIALSLTPIDLLARISSRALRKAIWNEDIFLVAQANGQNTLLLRGAYASSPGLLLKSFSSSGFPTVAATYPASTYRGISDRNVTLRIVDANGDDINDLVLGNFGSVDGETAYLADANNIHGQPMVISPGVPSSGSGTLVGAVAGQFRVDESGSATYSIPISVPQGVAGVSPKISINYSSQGGAGLVGYGASIAGLGAISRCRQTLLQDGTAKPISWSDQDRFCLNGQRLMLVAGSSYGAVGSVYKTEIDSYVQVTALNGTAGNPDYFEVQAKDGSKTIYGGTQNSKLYTLANKLVHWAQSRFEDNIGNRIDYSYEGDYSTGHRIRYAYYAYPTSKTSSGYNARVEFNYGDRADVSESYGSGGSYFKSTKILNSVISYNGSSIFRKYNFFYNEAVYSSVDSLSRLTSVEECTSDSSTSCYPRTRFIWGYKSVGFSSSAANWLDELPSKLKDYRFMDFNGDGRQDFLWSSGTGTSRRIEYGSINRYTTGGIQKQNFTNSGQYLTYSNVVDDPAAELELEVLDYNNDGRQDLAVCRPLSTASYDCASWDLYVSVPNSTGGWNLSNTKITLPFIKRATVFGDANADGLIDAIELGGGTTLKVFAGQKVATALPSSNLYYSFSSAFSTINVTGTPAVPVTPFPNNAPKPDARNRSFDYQKATMGDMNGDGQMDVMIPAITTTPPCSTYNICHDSSGGYTSDSRVVELFTYLKIGDEYVFSSGYTVKIGYTNYNDPANTFKNISFRTQDINNDGLSDLIHMDSMNWNYKINTGEGYYRQGSLTNVTSSLYVTNSMGLFDYNQDGYLDAIWHDKQNSKLKLRTWNRATNGMGADTDFLLSKPSSSGYSFGDMTGDGFVDLVEVKDNMDIGIFNGSGNADSLDKIYQISDGNNRKTYISYGSLANSLHYTTLSGVNTVATTDPNFCSSSNWTYPAPCVAPTINALNSASFYTQLNRPFGTTFETENPAPLLEVMGSAYVVTQMSESAPTVAAPASLKKVTYHYHHARMQAGGRGYLGFEKISTIDQQSGVKTETTYHQDWPFTGSPKSTVVKTKEGHKLSEATNVWAKATDSTNSRVSRVMQDRVTEISFELNTGGAVQGNSLQTTATDTDYDAYGNVTRLEVVTSGQTNTSTKTVVNTYPTDAWELRMGRITTSTTTTQRNSDPMVTRSSSFEYYGQSESWPGMLKKEIVEPGSSQLVTEYEYDSVGNKVATTKTANVKPGVAQTRRVEVIYDSSKRFVESTKDGLGNLVSGVIQRHPVYGAPTQIRDVNGVVTTIALNADGTERVRWDASGAGVRTERAYCEGSVVCPNHARIRVVTHVSGGGKTTEYIDVLGRVVRSSKMMFDGRESLVDTEYDILGRVTRKSEPYFNGETVYWSVFAYDLVNRPTSFTAPDNTLTTTSYSGYATTVTADAGTNGKKLTRIEERNSLGNLVRVTDHLQGSIAYGYDPLGNLTTATTTSGSQSVTVKMCYDRFGRKFAMHDPDKGGFLGNAGASCQTVESYLSQSAANKLAGWWFYKYNDFGELIEQTDTKRQVSVMEYDVLGRMLSRTDKNTNSSVDTHTRWYYDKYIGEANSSPNTQLKLTGVVTSYGSVNEGCGGANYCKTYTYDSISRVTDTVTFLPNESTGYINTVRYDVFGRANKQYDALNGVVQTSGTRTVFNAYGYTQQINDLATGDILQKTLSMNARGLVKEELRNNGSAGSTVYTYDNATGRLTNQTTNLAGILIPIQNVTYNWDALGNLKYRWNQSGNLTLNGSNAKKDLRESFCYDGLNRLIKSHVGDLAGSCSLSPTQQDQEYDGLGNITRKTGLGTYSYLGAGPHAVTSTSTTGSYVYDNNGNQISGAGRSIAYSTYDQPTRIVSANATTDFKYGPDRARFERKDVKNGKTIITQYLGNVERIQELNSSVVEWKRYIGGAIYTIRTINGAVEKTNKSFAFNDHLGSLDVVTDAVGKVTHSASFDAWGARRNGENWTNAFAVSSISLTGFDRSLTQRGYTGHEMLDDHGLIHMNGRIYDQKIARFLQADPFIQAAANTQSYNRYSYLMNNPLNATDPSGFFLKKLWDEIRPYVGAIIGIVVAIACQGWCTVQAYMLYGAIAGGVGAAANGGNIILGAAFGAFGGAFGGIGDMYGRFIAQGMVGGMQSYMAGGKFGHGFLAAGIGGAAGGGDPSMTGFVQSAVLGGVASEITGGKFKNGAATAAFMYAVSAGVNKIKAGGTSYEIESDPNAIDGISDNPEKTYQEGLALAKSNPQVDGEGHAQFVDKIKLGKCSSVDSCSQTKYFTSNAEAKKFMQQNKGWAQILGENSGSNTWIYRGATASKTHYFQDTVSALRRSSGMGCGCASVSGAENVLITLAHEGGHFSGLGHTNDLYIRERYALDHKRGIGL